MFLILLPSFPFRSSVAPILRPRTPLRHAEATRSWALSRSFRSFRSYLLSLLPGGFRQWHDRRFFFDPLLGQLRTLVPDTRRQTARAGDGEGGFSKRYGGHFWWCCAPAGPAGAGQMRTYLVRIPHRQGHSIQRDVLLASAMAGPGRRIHGPTRVGPHGRDLKLPYGNSDRTTGPKLGSSFLLSVLSSSTAPAGRLQYLGPGRRVGLCCEAT
jgi:hypothetical protein